MANPTLQQSPSTGELRSKLIDLVTEMLVIKEEIQQLEEELEDLDTDDRGKHTQEVKNACS